MQIEVSGDELEAILKMRKEKSENGELDKVVKFGFLKVDLYAQEQAFFKICDYNDDHASYMGTTEDINALMEDVKNSFNLAISKGTKFTCTMLDGEEFWYDEVGYGLEDMPKKWADRYLENVQPIDNP